ncbi:MAG: 4Fe-4S cluster-binding domain-containing protein [Alphaproteobacteria bacterium]|nr:4Fe-4S cluster-binding domain-containing protein [Alphaproteobacteria bacterium]
MNNIISFNDFCNFLNGSIRWELFIKVTNLCNLQCAHCCECSGPNEAPTFIPISDVRTITENFKREKNIYPIVAISGGEPMTAYKHKPYYIPQLIKLFAKQNFYAIELKTNTVWTTQPGADVIFRDLTEISAKYPKLYTMYHLSLDSFHANATKNVSEFIRWYYDNDNLSPKICTHIFYDNHDTLVNMLVDLAEKYNIMLDFEKDVVHEFSKLHAKKFINKDKFIVFEPYSGIENLGRAKQNRIATRSFPSIQKQFLEKIQQNHSLTFDNRGLAFIDCSAHMASTPYHDARGRIKPIHVIKRELFEILYKRYLIENGR